MDEFLYDNKKYLLSKKLPVLKIKASARAFQIIASSEEGAYQDDNAPKNKFYPYNLFYKAKTFVKIPIDLNYIKLLFGIVSNAIDIERDYKTPAATLNSLYKIYYELNKIKNDLSFKQAAGEI